LEAGDVDYSYVFPESARADIEDSDTLKLFPYNSTALQFFTLCENFEPFANKLTRQAINLVLNRDDIVLVAAEGNGAPTSFYCNTNTFGYMDIPGYKYDVDRAKALIAEAGYADGFKVKVTAQDAMTQKMAEILMTNLKDIGITAEIEVLESNTAVQNFMGGNYEIGVLGINNAQLDLDYLKIMFKPDGPLNLAKYKNPAIYDNFMAAAQIADQAKRLDAYRELNELFFEEAVYVPVYFPNRAHVMNKKLNITHVGGSSIAEIYNMYWEN
jgi:peptide/nickel transport system substrate-binding protein